MASRAKKKWSAREVDYLVDNYGRIPAKQIAKKLQRTLSGVHWKAQMLGLTGLNQVTRRAPYARNVFDNIDPISTEKPWWKFW